MYDTHDRHAPSDGHDYRAPSDGQAFSEFDLAYDSRFLFLCLAFACMSMRVCCAFLLPLRCCPLPSFTSPTFAVISFLEYTTPFTCFLCFPIPFSLLCFSLVPSSPVLRPHRASPRLRVPFAFPFLFRSFPCHVFKLPLLFSFYFLSPHAIVLLLLPLVTPHPSPLVTTHSSSFPSYASQLPPKF